MAITDLTSSKTTRVYNQSIPSQSSDTEFERKICPQFVELLALRKILKTASSNGNISCFRRHFEASLASISLHEMRILDCSMYRNADSYENNRLTKIEYI